MHMNSSLFRSIAISVALILAPVPYVHAATFLAPQGESASVRSETSGDLYAASGAVIVAAPVHGDIFAVGNTVDISGSSDASVFAAGRGVSVSGSVKDDVRVAGNTVSITSSIAHDAFIGGSTVFVGPDSIIGGDAYIAGNEVVIAGAIHGDVRVTSQHITVANTAVITGNLTTYQYAPKIEDGAKILGKVTTITTPVQDTQVERGSEIGSIAKSATSRALFALLLIWLAPTFIQATLTHATQKPVVSGFIGLGILVAFLPITLILAITGIGMHVAAFVFTVTMCCIALGTGVSAILIGNVILKGIEKKDSPLWHSALLGSIGVTIVSLLGGVGFLALCILFLIGSGSAAQTLKEKLHG